jgi:CBS domain-containing protein
MTQGAHTCTSHESLNQAAQLMWENDCGCIPVVDNDGRAVAMITDRDICMAAYRQGDTLARIPVSTAASYDLVAVLPTDDIETAEALMQKHQIRRIPVVDDGGRPIGMLSMNDLARRAVVGEQNGDLAPEKIVRTLAAVSVPTSLNVEH